MIYKNQRAKKNGNMKHNLYTNALFLLFTVCYSSSALAQTVNIGELTVAPGTLFSTLEAFDNTPSGQFMNDGDVYVYDHFNNDGMVDYDNDGLTRFVGAQHQVISGDQVSYLHNVLFDNAADQPAFGLSGDIDIANECEFSLGIVDNDTYGGTVTFGQSAYHMGTDHDSHVDGHVIKIGAMAFGYPIGDGGFYRHAGISAPDAPGDTFIGKYFFENPDGTYPLANKTEMIELIDDREYWTVTNDGGNGDIMLTLSWDEATTTPQEIIANPDAVRIVRWDDTDQVWVDEGGVVDASAKTVTTPLALDQYGVFTLARVAAVPADAVVVYNGITPNSDNMNPYFFIEDVHSLPNNKLEVFNRWGVKVFSTTDYDTSGNVFRGYSDGRMTISMKNDLLLPSGTYFYVLSYDYYGGNVTQRVRQVDYLYLKSDD